MIKIVDTTPAGLSQALGGLMTGQVGSTIVSVMIWIIVLAFIGGIFFAIYLFITYKYKIIIFKTQGDGHGGISLGKPFIELAKDCRDKSWRLLRKRKNIEPFQDMQRYGRTCVAYEVNNEIVPGVATVGEKGVSINPVPYSIRKKTELELQQLEQDFAKMDRWEANKLFIYMLIGGAIVIALAGFVIWLSFKKTDQLIPALDSFANSLKNSNTITGKG